ncbi:MAG TPA: hypothetical protein VEI82_07055 [Myxococcota bacterium]|nr:hypothetical protein [Myxococcota bacterium]
MLERHARCAGPRGALAALWVLALASCWTPGGQISPLMVKLGKDARTPVPLYGQAVVEFLRPNEDNSMTQSTVYDIRSDGDHFIGVVSGSSRVAYMAPMGEHLFMVIGESADFMYAELAEGKTYYVLVDPRVGWFKSRFSLLPVRHAQIGTPEFTQWESVEMLGQGPGCVQWARENVDSIVEKRNTFLPRYMSDPEWERKANGLHAEDGYP